MYIRLQVVAPVEQEPASGSRPVSACPTSAGIGTTNLGILGLHQARLAGLGPLAEGQPKSLHPTRARRASQSPSWRQMLTMPSLCIFHCTSRT